MYSHLFRDEIMRWVLKVFMSKAMGGKAKR